MSWVPPLKIQDSYFNPGCEFHEQDLWRHRLNLCRSTTNHSIYQNHSKLMHPWSDGSRWRPPFQSTPKIMMPTHWTPILAPSNVPQPISTSVGGCTSVRWGQPNTGGIFGLHGGGTVFWLELLTNIKSNSNLYKTSTSCQSNQGVKKKCPPKLHDRHISNIGTSRYQQERLKWFSRLGKTGTHI